jgi:hypothetical protein
MTEEQEQILLVKYLQKKGVRFSALPLSTFTKSWAVKMKNKRMGVNAGVPDLMVIIKNKLIFIEMKRQKGGQVSEYQKKWIEDLNNCEGVSAFVCNGYDEAKAVIDKYATN